ncbi:MAG: hypothetical protein A2V88_05020 [Elusimicrobia bacterium RBG_16_66_12]|nr:MAG: hypothetical protein A2V88_05020 [Elusimicrobia bacterium RBG_16_66_12]
MDILANLIALLDDPLVKILLAHVFINLVVALAAALKTRTLDLQRIAAFLTDKLLPYVLVYVAAKVLGQAAGLDALAPIAWAAIELALLQDLTDSLNLLGLAMPAILTKARD